MGAKHMKCCCPDCQLLHDDFDRVNNDDPGSNWSEESGDWDIDSNTLVGVTPGVLATTVCHPSYAPLGSFVATFDLVGVAGGNTYAMRAGNPADSTNEASWEFTGVAGAGTIIITVTNGTDTQTFTIDWLDEPEPYNVRVCYWPGVMLTASAPSNQGQSGSPSLASVCLGASGTGECFSGLGNFSFLEGSFDNFDYQIHWMEQRGCPQCGCTCREVVSGTESFYCIPDVLCATITNLANCPGVTQSQDMYLLNVDSYNDTAYPNTYVDPSRNFWISDPFVCPQSSEPVAFCIILECHIDIAYDYPRWIAYFVRWLPTGENCSGIGFDASLDTIIEACSEDGITTCYISSAYAQEGSTCDPFYLTFPTIIESFWGCPSETAGCCGGGVISEELTSDPAYMSLEITEGSCA